MATGFSFSFGFNDDGAEGPALGTTEEQQPGASGDYAKHPATNIPYVTPAQQDARREVHVGIGPSMWVTEGAARAMSVPDGVDLLPGVYEGGLKLWESSVDLVRYMRANQVPIPRGARVLELGCGHGLPGIHALQAGASVVFADLNAEVLTGVTAMNVSLNTSPPSSTQEAEAMQGPEDVAGRVRLMSGDWMLVSEALSREGEALFDVILTSETTYTEGSSECVATLLQRHLRPLTGLALVAGKRYYFGTGGSMSDVTQRLARRGLTDVKVVATLDDGRSNIRDILAIRKAA